MRRLIRILLTALAALTVTFLLLVSLLPWLVQTEPFRHQIELRGSQAFGRQLTVGGDIELNLSLMPRFVVEDVRVGNPDWASRPSLLTARRLELQVDLLRLLAGELEVLDSVFEGTDLLLERRADGEDNFTFKRGGRVVLVGDIDNFQLRDTVIAYRQAGETRIRVEILDATSQILSGELARATGRGQFRGVEFDFSIIEERHRAAGEVLAPWVLGIRSRTPDFNLEVDAQIQEPATWSGVMYKVKGEGRSTEPLRQLVGVELPELGEYQVSGNITLDKTGYHLSELAGRLRRGEGAPEIRVSSGHGRRVRGEGLDLELEGQVDEEPLVMRFDGKSPVGPSGGRDWPFRMELRSGERMLTAAGSYREATEGGTLTAELKSQGPDLGLWEPWLGRQLPERAYRAKSRLHYQNDSYDFKELEGKIGDLSIAADLRYSTRGPRPRLTGSVSIPVVNLAGMGKATGGSGLDAPFETDWLSAMDTQIKLAVGVLRVRGGSLRDLRLSADLKAGRLRLMNIGATLADSPLSGSAELWSVTSGLAVQANARGEKLDLTRLARGWKAGAGLAGRFEKLALTLSARGGNWREMLTRAELKLSVAPSKVGYRRTSAASPQVLELKSLTLRADRGGPLTLEVRGRVENRPVALTAFGHTLLGMASGPDRWPLRFVLKAPNARLEAEGTVADLWAGRGFDLRHRLTGDSFQHAAPAIDVLVPLKGRFELTGRFTDHDGEFVLSDLRAVIGDSRFSGAMTVTTKGERPRITAGFASPELHITDYTIGLADDKVKAGEEASRKVIPNFEIPANALRSFDLVLKVQVDNLRTPTTVMGGITSDLKLQDGLLTVKEGIVKGVGGATLSFDGRLDARPNPPHIELTVTARRLDYGRLLEHLEITDLVQGRIDLDFHLAGDGATRDSVMRSADGYLIVIGGEGRMASRKLELWAGDLTRVMLSPRWEGTAETEIECVVVRANATNGLAKFEAMLLDTSRLTIGGSGTLELVTEKIDMVLQPAPKQASLVSLASPARIQGTLARPQFSRTRIPTDRPMTAASGLLAGLVNPAFLVFSLSHAGSSDKNPCAAAIEKAGQAIGLSGRVGQSPAPP